MRQTNTFKNYIFLQVQISQGVYQECKISVVGFDRGRKKEFLGLGRSFNPADSEKQELVKRTDNLGVEILQQL